MTRPFATADELRSIADRLGPVDRDLLRAAADDLVEFRRRAVDAVDRCVCKLDDSGNVVALCQEHIRLIDEAVHAEREACAALADDMAREADIARENFTALGTGSARIDVDRHGHYASRSRQIAEAIRARSHQRQQPQPEAEPERDPSSPASS